MRHTSSSLVVLAFLFTAACGGSKPAAAPENVEPAATAPAADMPAPPATDSTADAKPPAGDTPAPGVPDPSAAPATLALPSASAKIDLKGKKAAKLELKSDGTIANGGKAVAKVSGMNVQSPDGGKTFLTVGSDGAVTTSDGGSYGSFSGDDLTTAKGDKLSLADDGTLTMTPSNGKAAPLGKFDGAGTAKRSAVLAAAFVIAPPAAPAADKGAAGAKPAAAGAKPAGKPAKK